MHRATNTTSYYYMRNYTRRIQNNRPRFNDYKADEAVSIDRNQCNILLKHQAYEHKCVNVHYFSDLRQNGKTLLNKITR